MSNENPKPPRFKAGDYVKLKSGAPAGLSPEFKQGKRYRVSSSEPGDEYGGPTAYLETDSGPALPVAEEHLEPA
jgi:hypothetical protein